jgi:hypothetical protein
MIKDHIAHEGLDIMEKRLASGKHLASQRIFGITPLQHGMEQQGEQVEAEQNRCEVLLTMAKVVLQMVALGLQDVVIFVCDLPAPTTCLCDGRDVVRTQAMIGDTAVVIPWFACFGIDHCALEPMDRQGIVTPTQEDVIDVTIHRHCRAAAVPTPSFPLGHPVVGLPACPPLIELGMGIRLARQDAMQALLLGQRTKRLLAVAIIAPYGHLMWRHGLGLVAEPPFARLLFAVLFGLPVLWHEVLGGQGDDVGAAWAHDDGGDRGVIIEGVTVRELPGETVRAMDGLGRKVGCAIECDSQVITQHTKVVEAAVLLETLEDFLKHGIEVARRDRIKQRADLIVTGDLFDAQQCLGVIAPFGVLQSALVL